MTDKERILTHILDRVMPSMWLHRNIVGWSSEPYRIKPGEDSFYPHYAPWKEAAVGDLVFGETCRVHPAKIGYVINIIDRSEMIIRGVGDSTTCRIGNERFSPILGLEGDLELLEGEQYQFYQKVIKAFRRGDEYLYRFGGLRFIEEEAFVKVRPHIFLGVGGDGPTPFEVCVPFRPRVSIKTILESMKAAGYGTAFERKKREAHPNGT